MIARISLLCFLTLTASAAEVRVRLGTAHDLRSIEIRPNPGASIQRCDNCPRERLKEALIFAAQGQKLLASGRTVRNANIAGQWQLRFRDGTIANGDSPLTIRSAGQSVVVVARMPLEDYVAQVLDAEASTFSSAEARRAMAVAVRTYAIAFRSRHAAEGFDLCDSTHCQALRIRKASPAAREAAESTEGELLWYRGTLAHSYYHRNCGGKLEDGRALERASIAYLQAKPDAYCVRKPEDWRS